MTMRLLRNGTALALSLSLALPTGLVAQDDSAEAPKTAMDCQDLSGDAKSECLESMLKQGLGQTQEQAAPEAPAEEAAPEAEPEAAPAEEAPVEEAPVEEAPAAEAPVEEPAPEAEEPAPEPAPEALPEATEEPAAEEPAIEEPAVEEPAQEQAAPEAQSEEAPAEDSASDAEEELRRQLEAETADEAPAEEEAPAETAEEAPAEEAAPAAELEANPEPEQTEEERAEEQRLEDERAAQEQAERQQQLQSAAAAQEGAEAEAVDEQEVTEQTSRSSGEEFQNKVNEEAPQARAEESAGDSDRDQLLDAIGKAALVGLGAYAVGKIMNNGDKVVSNSGDRVVVERDGRYVVLKDDDELLRRPGSDVRTETFSDGSTRSTVTRADGSQVVTIRAADGTVLRRTRVLADGSEVRLFDDTRQIEAVRVEDLPEAPRQRELEVSNRDVADLERALSQYQTGVNRAFSLGQVRDIRAVRNLVPEITVDNVNFQTGSAVIRPEEARDLAALGQLMSQMIEENPSEVFLVEGHTDAVGSASYNLALSDRRAESLALALTEYFNVPPENMIVQGYGESDLKIATGDAERANRRAVVRRITQLLQGS